MTEIVVIGAGVVGCSVALELARRGVHATIVDRNGEVGHGSTSASCGIVRRFYSTPTMTAMAHESAAIWADWGGYLGLPASEELARFERPGMVFLPPAIDDRVRGVVEHMRALGVEVELLSPEEIARRFPFLDASSHSPIRRPEDDDFFDPTGRTVAGAVFEPDSGYVVSPTLATYNLRVAAEGAGATFALGRGVTGIDAGAGARRFRLTLEDGSALDADVLLNASGPHSAIVNHLAGADLPIETRALRREVCAVANPIFTEASGSPVPVVGDVDSGIYFRPESGGRDLIVGSLDPPCDAFEWVDDPDAMDEACSVDGFERQVLRAMKRFPAIEKGARRGLASLYDVTTTDWNPVLDRTELAGYYVAIGTSGSSFKTAPVIGEVMAELVLSCEAGRDHDRDPLRLTLPRTGFEVDVGFFSRLRAAHATSGTVLA